MKIELLKEHNHDGTHHQKGAIIEVPEKLGLHLINNLKIAKAAKDSAPTPVAPGK